MQRYREFDLIRQVISTAGHDEPLTAREIAVLLREDVGENGLDNPHRIATVLGHHARAGEVEVIRSSPYRYRLLTDE